MLLGYNRGHPLTLDSKVGSFLDLEACIKINNSPNGYYKGTNGRNLRKSNKVKIHAYIFRCKYRNSMKHSYRQFYKSLSYVKSCYSHGLLAVG